MKKYSQAQLANVQNYLMLNGHACPSIDDDKVHYLDRSPGQHKVVKTVSIDSILEEIRLLKVVPSEYYTDKSIFQVGSVRYGIGNYQVMEVKDKFIYVENLSNQLKGLY